MLPTATPTPEPTVEPSPTPTTGIDSRFDPGGCTLTRSQNLDIGFMLSLMFAFCVLIGYRTKQKFFKS